MATKRLVHLHAAIASGSCGKARQRSYKWRVTDGVTHPVTVRRVESTTEA